MFLFVLLIAVYSAYDFYIITENGVFAEISSQTLNVTNAKNLGIKRPGVLYCATSGTEISFVNIEIHGNITETLYTIDFHGNIKDNKSYSMIGNLAYNKEGSLYATSFDEVNRNRDIIKISNNKIKYVFPPYDEGHLLKYDKTTGWYYMMMDRSFLHEQYVEVIETNNDWWRVLYMISINYGQITDIIPFNKTIYVFVNRNRKNQLWEISGNDYEKRRVLVEYPKFHGSWNSVLVNKELHTIMYDYGYGRHWVITDLSTLKYTNKLMQNGLHISCIF